MARYEGARPHAWALLSCIWTLGAVLGCVKYWAQLLHDAETLPSLKAVEGHYLLIFSSIITAFFSAAYIWAADRQGRRLSLRSLVLYPLGQAVSTGFFLLFLFDLGRWLRPMALGEKISWQEFGSWGPALSNSDWWDDPQFFNNFVWGFAPYTLAHAVLHSFVLEPLVLPEHLNMEAPNHFMKPLVVAQFSYIALYYATGDVFAYCFMRWVSEVLMVLAVRLPPPGAQAPAPALEKKKKL